MHRGYLFTILLLILALIFAIQNTQSTSLTFLVWSFSGSQALVTVIIFSLGFAAGCLLLLRTIWSKRQQVAALNREVKTLKQQLPAPDKPAL